MKNLFDIILEQVMKERDLPNPAKNVTADQPDEVKTLEEQAKEAVKKREKERLDELLKKKKKEIEEKVNKEKKKARRIAEVEKRKKIEEHVISILESPTKNLSWKCISGGSFIHGIANENPLFEIRRGITAFELRPLSHENKKIDMKFRLNKLGIGSIFTSPDIQRLKAKADKMIEHIKRTEEQRQNK